MKQRGRPKQLETITLDAALEIIKQRLWEKYKDESVVERLSYKKTTLYNKIYLKQLTRYGTKACVLVDKREILKLVA